MLFVDCVKNISCRYDEIGLEGIAVLDESGSVIYEKRWRQDYPRDIYSNTKSFTGAAVGIAIKEGLLSLDTRVSELFELKNHNEFWDTLKLKDLLTMRSGVTRAHLMYFDRRNGFGAENYMDYMLSQTITYKPGTHYLYSTGDSIMAGCMVEQAVGMSLHSYLYHRLFQPLGMEYPIWESDLAGHTCGGSGLQLKLVDMAKLGCVFLNRGEMNNHRFFDEEWADLSFREYVNLQHKAPVEAYGFFWRICEHGKYFKATGVFGQDTLVFPKEKLILGYQCAEGTDTNRLNTIIRKELLNKI